MRVVRSAKQMQKICLGLKTKKTIGIVPTMGFLHKGHLFLVQQMKKKADVVVVTIFVNPTQFGPKEDLSRYPRDEKGDLAKLKALHVDYVFIPDAKEIYPPGDQTLVEVTKVTQPLCGRSRPGHFKGVTTVVLKLFSIVQPDYAIFGQKDFQQLVTIKTMARDLRLPLKIFSGGIVREPDGLAMSSRNAYLSPEEREKALGLRRGLLLVKKACLKKNLGVDEIRRIFLSQISSGIRVDYIDCLSAKTLEPVTTKDSKKRLVAVAAFVGRTRLIDNILI